MLRKGFVGVVASLLVGIPLYQVAKADLGVAEGLSAVAGAFLAGVEGIGWVFVPQLVLGVAVVGAALQRIVLRLAGEAAPAPHWIDPAIESALLLGMLGTIHGMVNGFVGLEPGNLQPGPLVHALGTALRSSFVGFGIALVGVWTREAPEVAASG
jgi:hypothetical protein